MQFITTTLMAMVPLLIAVDPAASVVLFLSLADGVDAATRRKTIRQAAVTALAVSLGFVFLSVPIFALLGIDKADFQIGGGLILVVLSLADLVTEGTSRRHRNEFFGVVPIGTPLIAGPAVLTALTLLQVEYGRPVTVAALLATLAIVVACLAASRLIAGVVGAPGLKAVSKVISILLAGFGVHLVRVGVIEIMSVVAQ